MDDQCHLSRRSHARRRAWQQIIVAGGGMITSRELLIGGEGFLYLAHHPVMVAWVTAWQQGLVRMVGSAVGKNRTEMSLHLTHNGVCFGKEVSHDFNPSVQTIDTTSINRSRRVQRS
mmetsp:Transcript_94214/g.269792  ORF Transcript_94214/g.269792 Transcript_94214/m.269792 type:complete len:117 (+) Transcript_94214:400-750(+)